MIQLLEIKDGRVGRRFTLRGAVCRLGRDPSNDINLNVARVSRFHAELRREPRGGYELVDLDSANHTVVNGRPVSRCSLGSGDVVALAGRVDLVYLDGAAEERAALDARYVELLRDMARELPLRGLAGGTPGGGETMTALLSSTLDVLMAVVGAERGFIAPVEGSALRLDEGVARGMGAGRERGAFARSVMRRALEAGALQLIERESLSEDGTHSMIALDLARVVAAPLQAGGETVGVVYLDTRAHPSRLTEAELERLRLIADFGAIALQNARTHLAGLEAHRTDRGRLEVQERELARSQEMFRIVTEGSAHGIYLAREGRVQYANRAFRALLGAGTDLAWLLGAVEPAQRRGVAQAVGLEPCTGPVELRLCLAGEGGETTRHLLIHAQPMAGEPPDVRQGLVMDVTETTRLQQQLLLAQRMKAVGTLASGVAHDFNNLLTVIRGGVDMIADAPLPADLTPVLEDVRIAAERGAELASRLLLVGRRREVSEQRVVLSEAVSEVAGLLRHTLPRIIRVEAPDEGAAHCVRVDPGQLSQVLLNLGINARDAMPEGGTLSFSVSEAHPDPRVRARFPWLGAGRHACVRVRDTGEGMDAVVRAQVFEPFFTTKPPGEGTGLGLAMCWAIVRDAGGAIDVDTAPGRGTTFTLLFPVDLDAVDLAARRATPAPLSRRILLVAPDGPARVALAARLTGEGHRVDEVLDAEAAAARLRGGGWRPEAMVVTRLSCCRLLRASLPEVPMLLVCDPEALARAGDAPAGGWPPVLFEPVRSAALFLKLDEVLG